MNQVSISIIWIIAAGLIGFAVSAVFSACLNFPRRKFLAVYSLLAGIFLYFFFQIQMIDIVNLLMDQWIWGLAAGGIASIFLIKNVLSQPHSRQSWGGELVLDLLWLGLVYGILDALFLNVMPVLALQSGFPELERSGFWLLKVAVGGLSLLASLLVALLYHLGYREYRNRSVALVLVGNSVITLAYLLSGNPLAAVISHTVMHLAAVLQGPDTTIQLPPHTNPRFPERKV